MIVKRTRAAAGLATAFALLAVTAPGGPAGLVTSSEPVDVVVPPEEETSEAFPTGEIGYEPSESVSVEVPSVAGRDLAAASRTVVTRMQELEAGDISDRALGSYTFAAQAMQKADPDCAVSWSTLAAIGRIESAHGTKDGARLKDSGVADPAIRGAALNGRGDARPGSRTPTRDASTRTAAGTAPSARCSCCPPPGPTWASTVTATASAPPTTSTTPRSPSASTCAPPPTRRPRRPAKKADKAVDESDADAQGARLVQPLPGVRRARPSPRP